MTDQISPHALAESLSALMDNEASELELLRLLKVSEQDPELVATWSRYQVASAALRSELPLVTLAGDFASRVSQAIAAEETYGAETGAPNTASSAPGLGWWQNIGRFAVAASVAGGLVLGVQQYQANSSTESGLVAAAPAVTNPTRDINPADLPSGINAPALSARTVAVQSGYETRPQENRRVMFVPRKEASPVYNEEVSTYVNQLIEEHSGNAAQNAGQGMLPFTRVILTDEE